MLLYFILMSSKLPELCHCAAALGCIRSNLGNICCKMIPAYRDQKIHNMDYSELKSNRYSVTFNSKYSVRFILTSWLEVCIMLHPCNYSPDINWALHHTTPSLSSPRLLGKAFSINPDVPDCCILSNNVCCASWFCDMHNDGQWWTICPSLQYHIPDMKLPFTEFHIYVSYIQIASAARRYEYKTTWKMANILYLCELNPIIEAIGNFS